MSDTYSWAHCANPLCYEKLSTDWDCYVVNSPFSSTLKTYKCPYCNYEWTVNDMNVNSIKVTGFDKNTDFVIVNLNLKKVVGRFSCGHTITVDKDQYLHIPTSLVRDGNAKMFSIDKNLNDEEVIKKLEEEGNI